MFIIGPAGIKDFFADQLHIIKNLKFDVRCFELVDRYHEFQFEDCKLSAFKVKHGVATYGYTVDMIQAPTFDVEKAESYNIPRQFWEAIAKSIDFEFNNQIITREEFLGKSRRHLRVSYITDTAYTSSIAQNCKNADILILEGMYTSKYIPAELSDKMHLTYKEAGEIANEANANILCLTHYCARIAKPKASLSEVTAIHRNSICGYDGLTFTLNFNSDKIDISSSSSE